MGVASRLRGCSWWFESSLGCNLALGRPFHEKAAHGNGPTHSQTGLLGTGGIRFCAPDVAFPTRKLAFCDGFGEVSQKRSTSENSTTRWILLRSENDFERNRQTISAGLRGSPRTNTMGRQSLWEASDRHCASDSESRRHFSAPKLADRADHVRKDYWQPKNLCYALRSFLVCGVGGTSRWRPPSGLVLVSYDKRVPLNSSHPTWLHVGSE